MNRGGSLHSDSCALERCGGHLPIHIRRAGLCKIRLGAFDRAADAREINLLSPLGKFVEATLPLLVSRSCGPDGPFGPTTEVPAVAAGWLPPHTKL